MRTITWETASQIALRNCSEVGLGGGGQHIYDFGEGVYVQPSTHCSRGLLLVTTR